MLLAQILFVLWLNIHQNDDMSMFKKILIFGHCVFLMGCVGQLNNSKDLVVTTPETLLSVAERDIPPRKIPTESLYELMVADIALSRDQFDLALEKYHRQAEITGDPGVIELAFRLAQFQKNVPLQQQLIGQWLVVEPTSFNAHRVALEFAVMTNNVSDALQHGSWIYEHNGDMDALIYAVSAQTDESQDPELYIEQINQFPFSDTKQVARHFASALLYEKTGRFAEAEASTQKYLSLVGRSQQGLLLLSQLLHLQNKKDQAISLLSKELKLNPSFTKLRLQYARFLAEKYPDRAILELQRLNKSNPSNSEVIYLLGLMLMTQGDLDNAITYLKKSSLNVNHSADAQFHLGTIAERQNNIVDAINHYSQVQFGRNYVIAASRAAQLIAATQSLRDARQFLQRKRVQSPTNAVSIFQIESNLLLNQNKSLQALQVLTQGLDNFPNNPDLLYARSLLAEDQNNFTLAESDLRLLLAQDENNPMVLNALGYTMSLHSDRQEEAYQLIIKAYNLNPNSPAIIDSLGWVLFKLGQTREALSYLQKAYNMMADPEIAAHLGEVNWVLGNHETAVNIWIQALRQEPQHKAIIETVERLGVALRGIE